MTTYGITGATGQLGRLVVAALLENGIAARDIVAIVRNREKAADLAAQGVQVRAGDYDRAAEWPSALAGVDALLLVSSNEVGQRVPQHGAVIDAARSAGVQRIAYTSILRADTTQIVLAPEHKATEELLVASGLNYTFLRNSWYLENYTVQLAQYLAQGSITAAAGQGRIAAATRADYAAAAAAALTAADPDNKIYELGGTAFTLAELAGVVSDLTGTPVSYHSVSAPELVAILTGTGLGAETAGFVAALDEAIARGDLDTSSGDLERLIGRPSTPLVEAVRAAQ
jgi:NAD(P)H dehydrogenase (quinone)